MRKIQQKSSASKLFRFSKIGGITTTTNASKIICSQSARHTSICLIATVIATVALFLVLIVGPPRIYADNNNKIHETGRATGEIKTAEMDKSGFQPVPAGQPAMSTPSPGMAEQGGIPPSVKRVKRQHPHVHDDTGFSVKSLVELVFCFFLPPAAVALHGGPSFKLHILLNVVLCVLGWVPGILHAIWYCFMSGYA